MKKNFCYIHIPFCTSKCKYCRFASFGNIDSLKINLYIEKLINEIERSSYNLGSRKIESIYFGGGTPSVLDFSHLYNIIVSLSKRYIFDKNIEVTLETTPVTVTKKNILGWLKLGINRFSIGVQTLNSKSLEEIGRGKKGDILKGLNIIKKLIEEKQVNENINISVDFIIGLPHTKKGELKKDIECILHNYSFVNHVSVYMLEEYYNEGVDESNFEKIVYPRDWKNLGISEEYYLEEYTEIKNFLESQGFNRYEISNFAKKGYECKHNKAYWNHSNILSFGLGSYGLVNNTRFNNKDSFVGYYSGDKENIEVLDDNDIQLEKVMFGLRTSGLKKDIYDNLNTKKIDYFLKEGFLGKKIGKIILSDKGVLVLDHIIKEII